MEKRLILIEACLSKHTSSWCSSDLSASFSFVVSMIIYHNDNKRGRQTATTGCQSFCQSFSRPKNFAFQQKSILSQQKRHQQLWTCELSRVELSLALVFRGVKGPKRTIGKQKVALPIITYANYLLYVARAET